MGRAIRVLRRRRELSIEALAFAAGLHPTYLSGIEREGRNPSLIKLWALVDALDVSLGQMVGIAEGQARVRCGIGVCSPTSGHAANTAGRPRKT